MGRDGITYDIICWWEFDLDDIILVYMVIDLDKRPIREVAFLGDRVAEANYRNRVVVVANEIVQKVFNESNPNVQASNVNGLVNGLSGGKYKDVGEVEDLIISSGGKDRDAISTRDVLCDSLLLAMRDGGNAVYSTALNSGNTTNIENVLPDNVRVWGRDVRDRHIDDSNITAVLDQLSAIDDFPTREDEIKLLQAAGRSLNTLAGVPKEQLNLAGNAIKKFFDQVDNSSGAGSSVYLKQMAESEEAQAKLRKDIAEITLSETLDAYLNISSLPAETTVQPWQVEPPVWARSFNRSEWRDLIGTENGLLGAVYRKRNGGENASFKSIGESWVSMADMKDKDFHQWLNDPRLKLFDVSHFIAQELFVPKVFTDIVDGKSKTSKQYVFETTRGTDKKGNPKEVYANQHVLDLIDDQMNYKKDLAQRLVDNKIADNINLAKLAVAMSVDIMEIGGVLSGADKLRALTWESEAVRFAQQPNNKIEGKMLADEIIGGPWGIWAKSISETDTQAMDLLRSLKIVPKLLCGSFWDVNTDGDVSWADKIYNGVPLDKSSKYSGIFFGWRKNSLVPACDIMNYLTQKAPLQTNKMMTVEDQVSQWMPTLRNAIKALRGNGVSILTTEVMCATIGASTNIYPTKGHYLRIAEPNNKFITNYRSIGNQIFEGLVLSGSEMAHIKKFYGLDSFWSTVIANREVLHYGSRLMFGLSVKKGQK